MEGYGIISVLPVLTILVIAISTKRTLFAMVCGLSVGALILAARASLQTAFFLFGDRDQHLAGDDFDQRFDRLRIQGHRRLPLLTSSTASRRQ